MINEGNTADIKGNFAGKKSPAFRNFRLPGRKILLLIATFIFVIILYFFLPLVPELIKQTPLRQLVVKKVVLDSQNLQDLRDPNAPVYFSQKDESLCDQNHLDKLFGDLLVPGQAGRPLENNTRNSIYGESTWWYAIQGRVDKVQPRPDGITYVLSKGGNSLEIPATQSTAIIQIIATDSAQYNRTLRSHKVDLNSVQVGDKIMFYLTVKCGGGRAPLLFPDTLQKIPEFITRETAINTLTNAFACQKTHSQTNLSQK